MTKPTPQEIKDVMLSKGMKVFSAPFDMTLGGIRTSDNAADTFNDWLFMLYHDKTGKLCGIIEKGTTDAGLFYRLNPMHIDGTAIIQHDVQHMGVYEYQNPKIDGKRGHRGQEAFRQIKQMWYLRDVNRDKYLDFDGEEQFDIFNTNGHDMGTRGVTVGKNSAGCWGSTTFIMDKFYAHAILQEANGHGNKFSFAMLWEKTFKV